MAPKWKEAAELRMLNVVSLCKTPGAMWAFFCSRSENGRWGDVWVMSVVSFDVLPPIVDCTEARPATYLKTCSIGGSVNANSALQTLRRSLAECHPTFPARAVKRAGLAGKGGVAG